MRAAVRRAMLLQRPCLRPRKTLGFVQRRNFSSKASAPASALLWRGDARGDGDGAGLPVMLAAFVTCLLLNETDTLALSESSSKRLEEARELLVPKLTEIRERVRKDFALPSFVRDRKVTISVSAEGTICVSFSLPHRAPVIPMLVTLFDKLEASGYEIDTSYGGDALGIKFKDRPGSILVKSPVVGRRGEFMFFKDGNLTENEAEAIVGAYEDNVRNSEKPLMPRHMKGKEFGFPKQEVEQEDVQGQHQSETPEGTLLELGAKVYMPSKQEDDKMLTWEALAGYDGVKRDIEDTILLAVKHPKEFEDITKGTRMIYEKSKVRAVLFEGPPGCGKTSTARILSSIAGMPMVYVPVEAIMSKYFGESENRLSDIFKACERLGPSIVFLDEIDSLATSRSSSTMHEATRRILSVLLRSLDGFEKNNQSVLIAATNRKSDLDAALISRFNLSITFRLPDMDTRIKIFKRYAKQLTEAEVRELATQAQNFSGRDIKDICELAERRWASKRVRKLPGAEESVVPPFSEYQQAISSKDFTEADQGTASV